MSCEYRTNKIGKTGAIASGVAALSSKASNLVGMMVARANPALDSLDRAVNTVGKKTAPVTALAMNVIGPNNAPVKRAAGAMMGAMGMVAATTAAGQRQGWQRGLKAIATTGVRAGSALLP
jgi:hypothetical protein